jgi:hypothetical protein
MIKALVGAFLLLIIIGCTTVPISVNMPQDHPTLNLNTENPKFPFEVGLVISDSFSNFTIKSTTSHPNIDYNFQYDIGNDFSETLPEFFNKRFEKVTIIQSADNADKFNYIFIPNVSLSWLSTSISSPMKVSPSYLLAINLEIITYKKGNLYVSANIKEAIEKDTEVACWACWGESILNQQKIRDEYSLLLSTVYSRLDSYLLSVFKENNNVK